MVSYISHIFSGTRVHKNKYNTIFERYIFPLFKGLSGIDMLVILVELWYEMFWNFFINQTLIYYTTYLYQSLSNLVKVSTNGRGDSKYLKKCPRCLWLIHFEVVNFQFTVASHWTPATRFPMVKW